MFPPPSTDEMDFIFHMASFYDGRLTDTIYNPLPLPDRGGAPIPQTPAAEACLHPAAPTPFISAHTLQPWVLR